MLRLSIDDILQETHNSYTLLLSTDEGENPTYLAGQYLTLILTIEGEEVRRAYSLSSAPSVDGQMAISIKRVEGGLVSNYIADRLQKGDKIEALPPQGSFRIEPDLTRSRHYLMFAAGSGITPMISIIKEVLHQEPLSQLTLWYGNRRQEDIMFKAALDQLQQDYPIRLKVIHRLSKEEGREKGGRVDMEFVYRQVLELFMQDEFRKQYYICGPSPMMAEVYDALDKHAVHPKDIHMEYFVLPEKEEVEEQEESLLPTKPPLEDQQVKIRLYEEDHEIEVKADETLLAATIRHSLNPPYACRAGLCVSCKAKVKQGTAYMEPIVGLSDEEIEEGYILTCQAYPTSGDLEIEFD